MKSFLKHFNPSHFDWRPSSPAALAMRGEGSRTGARTRYCVDGESGMANAQRWTPKDPG